MPDYPKPKKLVLTRSTVELNKANDIVVCNASGQVTTMTYTQLSDISEYMKEPDRANLLEWLITYVKYMETDA